MTFSSTQRFCSGALVVSGFICLSSCAVPLAPGYQIEKQSITVRFVPGNPPHLAIRAEYRLANTGNSPLRAIGFKFADSMVPSIQNLEVSLDGSKLSFQPKLISGKASDDELHALEIPFSPEWAQKQKKRISIQYELGRVNQASVILFQQGFFLPESGWFPNPQFPRTFLTPALKRPNTLEVGIIVPPDFLAASSGTEHGTHKVTGGVEHRFVFGKNDAGPFILAGLYKEQKISTPDGLVIFWGFGSLPANQLQAAAKSIAHARKFLNETFGARSSKRSFTIAAFPNSDWLRGPDFGDFPGGLLVSDLYMRQLQNVTDRSAVSQTIAGLLTYRLVDETIVARQNAWLLSGALLVYVGQLVDEDQGVGLSRSATISQLLRDYDGQHSVAVVKTPLHTSSDDSQTQQGMALDQAKLFLFALEDKCGRENLEHAIAHMVYALRGQEYGYTDLRAALEQECHQDLSSMFATWLDQKGIPADFRARYQNGNEGKK